jgi:hypothetical protein
MHGSGRNLPDKDTEGSASSMLRDAACPLWLPLLWNRDILAQEGGDGVGDQWPDHRQEWPLSSMAPPTPPEQRACRQAGTFASLGHEAMRPIASRRR